MSVNAINQRHYGDFNSDLHSESSPEEKVDKSFASVIAGAVDRNASGPVCRGCVRAVPAAETSEAATPVAAVTTENTAAGEVAAENSDLEATAAALDHKNTTASAMYRFSVFVRISGDLGTMQSELVENFRVATKQFVTALHGQKSHGIEALDSYLAKAEESTAGGLQTSKSFIDNIIAAADAGLKAVTASISNSAWMTGLNSAAGDNSGGLLTSASPMDIARLQLQDAMQKTSASVAATAGGKVSYGAGYSLELVRSKSELRMVDASETSETSESVKTAEDDGSDTAAAVVDSGRFAARDLILEKFLQLIDSFSSSLSGDIKIVKAGFSFAYKNGLIQDYREVEAGGEGEEADVKAPVAGEAEEVIA